MLSGGLLREVAQVALPASVRHTRLYNTMVDVALRFMIQEVGQVEGVYAPEGRSAEKFLLKRAASHGIEALGLLAFHASPIWVLAALADVTGGGRSLISQIAQALKQERLLDPDVQFETVDQILAGLENASAHLASTMNIPPLDLPGLRREWTQLKHDVQSIPVTLPSIRDIETAWRDIQNAAKEQCQSVFIFSSLIALTTVGKVPAATLWLSRAAHSSIRRTGKVLGQPILAHYKQALAEISGLGFTEYWAREFRPYLQAAARQFAPTHKSRTERWLHRQSNGQT